MTKNRSRYLPAPDKEGGTHVDQVEGVVGITDALGDAPGNGHGGESPVVANLVTEERKKRKKVNSSVVQLPWWHYKRTLLLTSGKGNKVQMPQTSKRREATCMAVVPTGDLTRPNKE